MRAIVKAQSAPGLEMQELAKPTAGPGEVLIRVKKSAICGTDIHIYKWDAWAQKTVPVPTIIGHEFVGVIEDLGEGVTGFTKGQRVSGEGHITCGKCHSCLSGRRVLCPETKGIGYHCPGAFADFFNLPAENVFPLPDSISDEIASIFDPLGNTVFTAMQFPLAAKDVWITGAGPIGLMAIPVAKKLGARRVVISDLNPYRLKLAEKFAPGAIYDISKGPVEGLFNVCLEMSGSKEAFASIPPYMTHGGEIALLGILPEDAHIDWHQVIFKLLTIKGVYGREIFRTWQQMVALIESGLDVTPVITHRFPIEEFEKGFEVMLSGQSGKVILDWES